MDANFQAAQAKKRRRKVGSFVWEEKVVYRAHDVER